MTVNITQIQQISNIVDAINFINSNSYGMFFTLVLVSIYITLIMVQKRFGIAQAITVSSFACFVLSLIFGSIGLVNVTLIIMFFMFTIMGGFYLYAKRNID